MNKILEIDPNEPQVEKIDQAARTLYNGGIIGYPTETIYGIGCSAFNNIAVQKIYDLKGRDQNKAMILIAADMLQVHELVKAIPTAAEKLINSFWPGPLTLVFEASEKLHQYAIKTSTTIAVRIPACPICLSLLKSCDFPVVSTSANLSGSAPAVTAHEVEKVFGDQLDLIIDGGPTPSDAPSTVVDVTGKKIKIIRKGAISELEINTAL